MASLRTTLTAVRVVSSRRCRAEHRRRPGRADWRVDEHDRVATVEFGEQRVEGLLAQVLPVDVGQEDDTVGMELVEGVLGFGDRTVDVGQCQRREEPETPGPALSELGGGLVDMTGGPPRVAGFAEVHPGVETKQDAPSPHRGRP